MRRFHLGDVLSITTGRLVSPSHIDGVYAILNYMTRDNLFTHQLPRASKECAPWLLRQHPKLAEVKVPDEFSGKAHVDEWLAEQVKGYGETLEIQPIPQDDHDRKNPLTELEEMVGKDRVIPIVIPDSDESQIP
jgi:hypothetical protein